MYPTNHTPPPAKGIIPTKYLVTALSVILGAVGLAFLVAHLSTSQTAEETSSASTYEITLTPEDEATLTILHEVEPLGVDPWYINPTTFNTTCSNLYDEWYPNHNVAVQNVSANYYVQARQEGYYDSNDPTPWTTFVESIDDNWCSVHW